MPNIADPKPESESSKPPLTWDEDWLVRSIITATLHDPKISASEAFSTIIDEFMAAGNKPEDVNTLMLKIKSECEARGIELPRVIANTFPASSSSKN